MLYKKTQLSAIAALLFLIVPFAVKSQSKFYVGLEAAPQAYYGLFSVNGPASATSEFKSGLSLGIPLQLELNERWALKSGLFYSGFSYVKTLENLVFGNQLDPRTGNTGGQASGAVSDVKTTYQLKSLEVPVNFLYDLSANQNTFFLSFGLATQYFIDKKGNLEVISSGQVVEQTEIERFEHFNAFSIYSLLGFGYRHHFSDKFMLQAAPEARFSILPVSEGGISKDRLFAAGLHIGVYYAL